MSLHKLLELKDTFGQKLHLYSAIVNLDHLHFIIVEQGVYLQREQVKELKNKLTDWLERQ